MKKFCLLLLMLASTAALSQRTLSYQDKLGRTVSIQLPVRRAAVLQLYEFLPALHAWDRVAGVGRYAYENDLMLASRPDIAKSIPSVGSGTDINMEALMKLKPDLVITWTFKPENVKYMDEHGIKSIAVYPDSVAELYDLIHFQGEIFQREKEAANVIGQMDGVFNVIHSRVDNISHDQRKKVLWIGGRQNSVAGASGLTDNILNLVGGRNVAGGIQQRNADVSIETIIGWNPDVIFIWGNAKYEAKDILNSPQWSRVKAVRDGQVFKAPEWSTWSPRLAPVCLWMSMKLYPERYKDVNLYAVTDAFDRKVFNMAIGRAGANAF
jgi:iron complex transport system substrate-binding protein